VEEFLTLENTSDLDVLQVISVIIFIVHLHKRLPVELDLHFVVLQKYAHLVTLEFGAHLWEACASVDDVFESPLLPGLLVFIEWFSYSPDMIMEEVESNVLNQELENRIERARCFFWRCCQGFLKSTLAGENMPGHDDFFSSHKELVNRVALWEDIELQGYIPIAPVHRALKLSRLDPFRSDENKIRIRRIINAIQKAVPLTREASQLQDKSYSERAFGDQSSIIRDGIGSFSDKNALHAEKNFSEQLNSGVTHNIPEDWVLIEAGGSLDDLTEADKATESDKDDWCLI